MTLPTPLPVGPRLSRGIPPIQTPLIVRDWMTLAVNTTLTLAVSDVHLITLGANITLTLASATVPNRSRVRVELIQDATGTRTVTWVNAVWPAATAPTLTATAGHIDILEFTFITATGKWRGVVIAQNYAT